MATTTVKELRRQLNKLRARLAEVREALRNIIPAAFLELGVTITPHDDSRVLSKTAGKRLL
jgi:type II secretory pathway component PulM